MVHQRSYASLSSWWIQVGIDERRQMLSIAEEVTRGDNRVTRNFAFHDDVALMNERVLETVSEIIDRRSSRRR